MFQDLGLAFAAGLLSCASACVLPLLPAYVAYLGGVGVAGKGERGAAPPLGLVARAGLFVAGFGSAFVALGALAGLAGAGAIPYRAVLGRFAGAALVIMGLALLGGVPWLLRERRLHIAHRLPRAPWAAFVVGLAFAIGWTPCVGPILTAVLIEAASRATAAQGALLLGAYSAGMGLPFLATAAFLTPMTRLLARARGAYPVLNGVAAAFLISLGLLTAADRVTVLNKFVPGFSAPVGAGSLGHLSSAAGPAGVMSRPAPAVTVSDLRGRRLSISSLRGRPVVVTFWATWCDPCRDELPLLAETASRHSDQQLALVAIDYMESPQAIRQFWDGMRLPGDPYLDPEGQAAGSFGVGLQQGGLPVTVFIDRDGTVRSYVLGMLDRARVDALVAGLN